MNIALAKGHQWLRHCIVCLRAYIDIYVGPDSQILDGFRTGWLVSKPSTRLLEYIYVVVYCLALYACFAFSCTCIHLGFCCWIHWTVSSESIASISAEFSNNGRCGTSGVLYATPMNHILCTVCYISACTVLGNSTVGILSKYSKSITFMYFHIHSQQGVCCCKGLHY